MDKIFQALASTARRKILAYLSAGPLSAGEISERFEMTKPSVSKHLSILENAQLVESEKKGQFVFYTLKSDNLVNSLHGYAQKVCPVSRPLKREAVQKAKSRKV